MRRYQFAGAFLLLALVSVPAAAQEDPTSRRAGNVDIPLLERSRVFVNIPNDKTGEIYEGFLALHFPVRGNMQDGYSTLRERLGSCGAPLGDACRKTHVWNMLASASMIVNLRQTHENSAPVRTPSYMPRVRATFVHTNGTLSEGGVAPSLLSSRQWIVEVTPIGHYSNGQDGCLFVGQDSTKDCTFPAPVADSALVVNRINGSFSSHYIEGALARRWLRWNDQPFDNGRRGAASVATAFLRVRDYKLYSGLGGGMEQDLRRLYGTRRVRAGAEYQKETTAGPDGPWWLGAWIEKSNSHAPKDITRWRWSAEFGKTFDAAGGTGLFARWYYGHDDYNLGFLQKINVLQVGITLGGERRPTYNR